ncbi:cell division protein DivIB [Paenibacillus sp. FSL R7-0273]|uniref:cell division protein FtsQ/DivIB n=1 Tax=Paenibacillus sp. FSL R7-0273 TaxID=1536772 RepID=UPI0004F92416|nr:FtsQ-type POTRA domain-containing protein [Paenibacillus sp. FSL R7-0273]AIQ48720.1 cell division protein DivIB [Paenibacillus sp. FSL R7-0273]OMF93938.1 cell division protein DivIB [Paenibacillus sp. FSL R7-0273]
MPKTRLPRLKEDKPVKKMSRKITVILLLLFLALLAVIFFRSSVSRITEINFQGNKYTTREELLERSGLVIGGQFFAASADSVKEALKQLKTVQEATVVKNFPGIVNITIEEFPAVAYELDQQGILEAILSSGAAVKVNETGIAVEKPILTGWKEEDPYKSKLSQALAAIPNELTSDISEIVPSPTLSFPDRIKLYTRSHFEVITAISLLKDKVEYLNQVIETEEPGLIKMLEADTYVPFAAENEDDEDIQE